MKFGFFLAMHYRDFGRPYGELLDQGMELTVRAEELGYDAVFIPEHHFINYITLPSALQFAVKAAALTKRIRFVTAILVLPYYHPMALAEDIAQADWMTDGRLEIGVARGGNSYEAQRLGLDFKHSRERFEEGLDIMLKAWEAKQDFAYEGKFYSFPATTLIPEPLQKPHPPLWVTAQSLNGARGVAKSGLNLLTMPNYNSFAPKEDLPALLGEYRRHGGGEGVEIGLTRKTFIGESEDDALKQLPYFVRHWQMYMAGYQARPDARLEERIERPGGRGATMGGDLPMPIELDLDHVYDSYDDPIVTTPDKAIERIRRYQELGITYLVTNTAIGVPHRDVLRSLELFAKEVMPHFRS
jgi:alkanesulfonate monooxygenase SsuD/methylene tetrahydromethanopterin reductase-like flavin-dependent oxidoreductase (luciferase family)